MPARTRPASNPVWIETSRRMAPWAVRLAWVPLPFTAGALLDGALEGHSTPVRLTAFALAWALWGVGLLATLVPHPVALTALRTLTPLVALGTLWSAATGDPSATLSAAGVAPALVAAALAGWSEIGHWAVNGPAYPNERRFLLRPPGPLLLGPLPLAWALAVVGVLSGPLLLSARAWAAGGVALVVGVPVSVVLLRSLHGLSRRFLVLVPAGFVVHDLMSLREPVLFPRNRIRRLHAAPAGTDSLDLTWHALGIAVEVLLLEEAEVTLLSPRDKVGTPRTTDAFLVAPTLPGRLLQEAGERRLPTA